jgi:hypothetical protein
VVEVQVRVDHHAHVLEPVAGGPDPILEQRAPVGACVLDAVQVVELGRLLVAEPGVDEHQPHVVLDEQAAHPHRDAVARVGRIFRSHSGLGTTPNIAPPSSCCRPPGWRAR